MSASSLNGKELSVQRLWVNGGEITGGGGGGSGASILGDAVGSVATNTSGELAMSVSATPQTGVLTTATTIVLPPAGSSSSMMYQTSVWDERSAYAVNDVVNVGSLTAPTGTFVCINAVTAAPPPPAAPNAPPSTSANWNAIGGGVTSVTALDSNGDLLPASTGVVTLTSENGDIIFTSTGGANGTIDLVTRADIPIVNAIASTSFLWLPPKAMNTIANNTLASTTVLLPSKYLTPNAVIGVSASGNWTFTFTPTVVGNPTYKLQINLRAVPYLLGVRGTPYPVISGSLNTFATITGLPYTGNISFPSVGHIVINDPALVDTLHFEWVFSQLDPFPANGDLWAIDSGAGDFGVLIQPALLL